ncbi:hypothetical protein Tco_0856339 [Tanacetum coccineum]|uniref:Retrotransposon gag domain-containing protein n=1 Tax=Tanacetum coccineum TaxID=301880 RepID=A0ABQ5B6I3_9ASTR
MKGFLKEISGNRRTFKVGTLVVRETTRITHASGTEGAVELRRWFEKTEMTFGISECAEDKKVKFDAATLRGPALTWWNYKVAILGLDVTNQIGWTKMKKLMTVEFCPAEELKRMENELWNLKESVKIDAYIRGLSNNIKGEVTSSKPTNLNEAENFQSRNSSGKSNHKDNSRQSSQNNQKQGNARAMTTAPDEGKVSFGSLPVCECCFTPHVGQCTIKCHKCGKIGHEARNRCPKKVKQEEVGRARGRAYAIKDDESYNGMDLVVKHDAVIVCGEKVVRIPYGHKTLTVKSDKGASRLKVIYCIKACKYIECHFFLAHVTEKKLKERRLEDVPVIRDFPEVFPDDFPGLLPPEGK